jgi:hypothetical protein
MCFRKNYLSTNEYLPLPQILVCFVCAFWCNTTAQAQDFYDVNAIRNIEIKFDSADWDAKLDSTKRANSEHRQKASAVIEGQRMEKISARYKGNSSYFNVRHSGSPKLPFNIKLDGKNKAQVLSGKYGTLKLANGFRDPSMIREVLSYEIVRDYMPASQSNFAQLTVNGTKLGLYTSNEDVDEPFTERTFGTDKGWFVKCDPETWDIQQPKNCPISDKASLMYLGEDSTCYQMWYDVDKSGSYAELIKLTRVLNQEPDKIHTVLDIDQTLWMLALDNILVNLDSYVGRLSHNYYLYHMTDGRFTPIIWDLNLSFGGFPLDGYSPRELTLEQMQTLSPLLHIDNPKRPLISGVLKNPTYRKLYIAHFRTILKDWFTNGKYLKRAKEWQQHIDAAVQADAKKLYTYEAFQLNLQKSVQVEGNTRIVGIQELMEARINYLSKHPLILKTPPSIEKPTTNTLSDKISVTAKVTNTTKVYCVLRNGQSTAYRYFAMLDDGKHDDGAANDGVFGVVVNKKEGLQYYILAENEEAAATLPDRAGWKDFFELN